MLPLPGSFDDEDDLHYLWRFVTKWTDFDPMQTTHTARIKESTRHPIGEHNGHLLPTNDAGIGEEEKNHRLSQSSFLIGTAVDQSHYAS